MKRLPFLFFILALLSIFSFDANAAVKGVIRGKVMEEIGGLFIPYAAVSLYEGTNEQTLLVTQSDENGFFKISNLKVGTYRVKISYVGYTNFFVNEIIITEKEFDKNLGNLKLASEQSNLNEVVITAQKPLVEFSADVITYNVGSSVLAEGSTATDVLKNVPMVQLISMEMLPFLEKEVQGFL